MKRTVVAALVLSLVFAAGAVAASDGGEVLYACSKSLNGQMRLVDDPSDCSPAEEDAVMWNVQGPQGPPGPPAVEPSPILLGPAGFVPVNAGVTYRLYDSGFLSGDLPTAGSSCLLAPIDLPDGVEVTEIVGNMRDDDQDSPGWSVYVYRKDADSVSGWNVMAIVAIDGNAGFQKISTTQIDGNIIDNTEYIYYARACLRNPNTGLYSVEFHFTQ